MCGFHHATILSPSFYSVRKEHLAQWPPNFWPNNDKNARGVLPEKLGGDVRPASCYPYPISDQNLWFSLTLFQTWAKIWHPISDLKPWSPARDKPLHTQFKTRGHKPYPISDQNGRSWYPVSDQNGLKTTDTLWRLTYPYSLYKGLPPGAKNALQIMSLTAYASKTKKHAINSTAIKVRKKTTAFLENKTLTWRFVVVRTRTEQWPVTSEDVCWNIQNVKWKLTIFFRNLLTFIARFACQCYRDCGRSPGKLDHIHPFHIVLLYTPFDHQT